MIDGGDEVPAFVSDDREVVVRAGVLRVERDSPSEKIARLGRSAGGLLHERQVDERFDVPQIDPERDSQLSGADGGLLDLWTGGGARRG
jgi:hypothetical protein